VSNVRVVRDVPCRICWVDGEQLSPDPSCPICEGHGTSTKPVTCAGCLHFQPLRDDGGLCLAWVDASGYAGEVHASFACAAWEPRQ
jgi:hypothetical protein